MGQKTLASDFRIKPGKIKRVIKITVYTAIITEKHPHFLWADIRLGKFFILFILNKNTISVQIEDCMGIVVCLYERAKKITRQKYPCKQKKG